MASRISVLAATAVLSLGAGSAGQALAWGAQGHRFVAVLGLQTLPAGLPAFLQSRKALTDIGELAREPDRSRTSGRTHDTDRDPGHFADADDDGKMLGGPALGKLPITRFEYEKQLQAVGTDSWKAGYLPYNIVEGWQQIVKDFAYWRADTAGLKRATDKKHKAWLTQDRARREAQTLIDLGTWAHFVGDGSQPMHTTAAHFNGWGNGPNPKGYTTARVHYDTEGPFVSRNVKIEAVKAAMRPAADCGVCNINEMTGAYLVNTYQYIDPFYDIEKEGGFKGADPRGAAFMTARIADGAAEMRDLVVAAWNASGKMIVGDPDAIPAEDVEAGKAGDAYVLLYGVD